MPKVSSADGQDDKGATVEQSLRLALKASEARFRNVIEANADGVIVVSPDGVIAFANPAATVLLGRRAEDLVGQVFGIPLVAGETTEVDVPRAGKQSHVAELRVVETQWEGEPALLASLRDVTERKRLEEELRRHAEHLAEADRRKDQFLAMLAHELRNPLAPILSAAHLMRLREDDPAVLQRMRNVVEQQANHIGRLVDDLLDVSRFTQGKFQLRKVPVNLKTIIAHALEAASPIVEARGHTLAVAVASEPLWLEADPTRIRQVLANLIDNAVKYTDSGGTIHLSAAREGDEAVVKVRDSGIGISPDMLPRVFDLFAQADYSLERSRGGLGVGLTLVRSMVALHGGSVAASSAGPGLGSEFVARLPIATTAPPEVSPVATTLRALQPTQPRHVLVVDDNRFAADSLAALLELSGHHTRVAYTGRDALEMATDFQPEVVLLDIGLPEMDGFEVARRLRQREDLGELVLVAITGYGHEEAVRKSGTNGFDHHLVKPVDLDGLLALIGPRRGTDDPPI